MKPPIQAKISRNTETTRGDKLSVLIIMNDGVSHMNAKRQLNRTYHYLTKKRGGVVLNGYTSVGKNTFPNMVPYLTGM